MQMLIHLKLYQPFQTLLWDRFEAPAQPRITQDYVDAVDQVYDGVTPIALFCHPRYLHG